MPIHDSDWSLQFFEGVPCPEDVHIPASDPDAWSWSPKHRWVYNKLDVALSQGLTAAPYGVIPDHYPVFCKPMMNLHGMGAGSAVLTSEEGYDRHCGPGSFWMPLLEGAHVSSDVALIDGEPRWWRHATGVPASEGMFDYWTVHAAAIAAVENPCGAWLRSHLTGYTGMANLETIGARIIECHLRFSDQWPDIYGGRAWVEALIGLYTDGRWSFEDRDRRDGYSVALFGPQSGTYRHPAAETQADIRALNGVSSLQITFHEATANDWHSNPPGGFRLAVVNGFDLGACRTARQRLVEVFGLARAINT